MDQPKAFLFDLGGVCVCSPFQAILDHELRLGIPPGWVNYSISKSAPDGFWHRLERGAIPMDAAFFAGFTKDLHDKSKWESFYKSQQKKNPHLPVDLPPLPKIDGEKLFNEMMAFSSRPDPWMFPAVQNLRASGKFIIAALSNTVLFPPNHPLYREDFFNDPVRQVFDVFISSAHVGLRKPNPEIYRLALTEINRFARDHGVGNSSQTESWPRSISPHDVVFLDDIGENLRTAKNLGIRTIKVHLGRSFEAVNELEQITGLKLAGNHPIGPDKVKM